MAAHHVSHAVLYSINNYTGPFLDFEVCSQPQVHTIGVGDNVLSKCILNTMARADLERIEIFYHNCTNGSCSTDMYIAADACSSTAKMPGLNFELVVLRPDKYNATIYIFNVTEETSLNVYCNAKNSLDPMSPLITPITISTSALMITFIMSSKLYACITYVVSMFTSVQVCQLLQLCMWHLKRLLRVCALYNCTMMCSEYQFKLIVYSIGYTYIILYVLIVLYL